MTEQWEPAVCPDCGENRPCNLDRDLMKALDDVRAGRVHPAPEWLQKLIDEDRALKTRDPLPCEGDTRIEIDHGGNVYAYCGTDEDSDYHGGKVGCGWGWQGKVADSIDWIGGFHQTHLEHAREKQASA